MTTIKLTCIKEIKNSSGNPIYKFGDAVEFCVPENNDGMLQCVMDGKRTDLFVPITAMHLHFT